jgi:hypothetical protein
MDGKRLPVLFLIFKRRFTALKAFAPIRDYKPDRLYIAADGPRENISGEKEDCEATRKAIIISMDWDCEVKTLIRDENLGCNDAVNSGITWFLRMRNMV